MVSRVRLPGAPFEMKIEYEATFPNVDKEEIRKKLSDLGAELVKKEVLMRRSVFYLPNKKSLDSEWLRVRDEGDKITLSLKGLEGGKIEGQKEICLVVDNQENAENFLECLGCEKKAYQETKREIWHLDNVEICIDEWPFLEPFVEIEGDSEGDVKKVSEKLGFNWEDAIFESVDYQYNKKYGISRETCCDNFPRITFDENPFENLD